MLEESSFATFASSNHALTVIVQNKYVMLYGSPMQNYM